MQAKLLHPVSWDGLTEDKFIPVAQQKHVVWLAVHVEISGSLMPPAETELWKVSSASLLVFPSLYVDVSTREASVWCGLLCSFICLCSSSRSLALTHRSNNSLCFLACLFFSSWFVWKGCHLPHLLRYSFWFSSRSAGVCADLLSHKRAY